MVHTRFDEEDEDMGEVKEARRSPEPRASASSKSEPLAPSQFLAPGCSCSVRVDFHVNDPCYVWKAVYEPVTSTVVATVSDGALKAYAVSPSGGPSALTHSCDLAGHSGAIRDVGFFGVGGTVLHSVSADGTVRGWDVRSGKETERFTLRNQELFSLSLQEHMVVAGGAGQVLFWDRRAPSKQLAVLEDTHMDDVTQVKLHANGRVISASADGLIAVHDTAKGLDDDDAFLAALNLGNSVEELGLYGVGGDRLWARTGTESLHLWHWSAATAEDVEGGDVPAAEWVDARGAAAAAAAASTSGPAAAALTQVDYLIGCHYDSASDRLSLMAGTNDGAAAFFPLDERQGEESGAMAPPAVLLHGGHTAVVRSAQCFGSSAGGAPFCLTGGEDALICLWAVGATGGVQAVAKQGAAAGAGAAGAGAGGPKRQNNNHKQQHQQRRTSPY